METRDGREIAPKSEQKVEEADAVEYTPPVVVRLGRTKDLILGYWDEGWADYSSKYKHAGE